MESLQAQISAANLSVDDTTLRILEELHSRGTLSIGWPGNAELLPTSFVWTPQSWQARASTSIVSSRLGRQIDSLDAIFRVLRSAVAQLDPQRQSVLSVDGTTTHEFLVRACGLFGIPLVNVRTPSSRTSLSNWAKATLRIAESHEENERNVTVCCVSNPLQPTGSPFPIRDEIEVLASDQLLALNVRPNGNLHRLISVRLAQSAPSRVFLAIGDDELVTQDIAGELMDGGAVGWLLFGNAQQVVCPMDTAPTRSAAEILDITSIANQDRYFTHCTRRARGPWPDQREEDFLDELILGEATRDRSSFSALIRIVRMQRLLASGESIRDSTPVVSLTAARLDELAAMRTFRSHRGRWDFEPYGISIDRQLLLELGAREVIYGDDAVWKGLASPDRPLFQKIGESKNSIDWSIEKEWRVLGDIDLSKVPSDKAFVFVPTRSEAENLAEVSRWPVVVMDANEEST